MSFEWKEVQLKDLVTLKRGYDLPTSKRNNGPYPILASNGVNGFHNEFKVKGPGIVTGRSGTLGEVYYIEGDYWPLNTTLYGQDFKGNDVRFVYYFLKTLNLQNYNAGSSVPTLNRNHIHSLLVRIPDVQEQKNISILLWCLDQKIHTNNNINKNLEEMAQTIFKRWFVDFEFPNENGEPYKSNGGEFEESELGLIPKGWRILRIGDIAEVRGGKRLPKGHELLSNRTEHPYIRITDIDNGRINMRNLMYLKDETFKQISRYIINKNDLFVSIVGTVGIVGSINPNLNNANLTENMAKITIFDVTNKHYLLYYLKSNIGQQLLLSRSVGSTQPKLALIRIKNVPVLLPEKKSFKII
ncbi:EcoKI restriction-modification system protein HsdS [Paenibacillus sp. P1XP2]|nr:EcoKI restriction-modification system protein HsdS [Paenibacillus sp. P1XP2]